MRSIQWNQIDPLMQVGNLVSSQSVRLRLLQTLAVCASLCVCLSSFYGLHINYYGSDFDETWWKCWNLDPIDCTEYKFYKNRFSDNFIMTPFLIFFFFFFTKGQNSAAKGNLTTTIYPNGNRAYNEWRLDAQHCRWLHRASNNTVKWAQWVFTWRTNVVGDHIAQGLTGWNKCRECRHQ